MKRILLLSLLLLPIVVLAQYPTFSNKQKLGVQTTGDGLIFRGNLEVPNYIPSNVNNAYFYLDTVRNTLKFYKDYWIQIYPTPQFDTTTLNVYLKISDTTAMLLPYFRDSDTTSLNLINRFALKLNISDTATMLTPYMKKADTISLSNRINLKLNISDTTILSNRITTNANNIITINNKLATKLDTIYVKFKDVVTMIENKDTINIGSSLTDGYAINIIGDSVNIDTVILDIRYPDRDSTNELQDITFATTAGIVTISGGKVINLDTLYNSVIDSVNLLIRDSIAAFTPLTKGYGINITGDSINVDTTVIFTQSDTITLSNRIDTKLNASDTASLSNRINNKLDTIYVNYQTNVDVVTNKDTINIIPLTEGFGINIIGDSINIDSAVILATQQKQIAYVKNMSGVTMYKGQAVYSSGSTGDNKLVQLASSNTEQASSKTFGIVETDSIPNGSHGYIITFGLLSGINTDDLNEGSSVYLSSTSGQLTSVKPIAPLHLVTIGICIRKQQNNGSIFVKIQNGFEFDELHDVRLTTPVDKASIYYNLSENLWRDTTATLLVSDTASMLNPYLRKLDTISLSNRINLKFNTADTSILGYVTTYSNQLNINGNKTFNNTVSVDSLNATKQAKIQSLTVGKGGYTITGGTPGAISSTAFGFEALKNNTSGDWNTAIGYQALLNNTTGEDNVAIGYNALKFNTTGRFNTAVGSFSLDLNIIGNNNTTIGYNSGNGNKGDNNIFIGSNSGHLDSFVNNVLIIGAAASPLLTGILSGNKKLGINKNPLTLTHTFEVNSPISDAVKINSNTNSTNLELMNSSGSVFIKSTNRNMVLQTDTTALMYLNGENNRVGILTMTPEQALQVAGTIRVDSLVNNLTPDKLVGANNANDLTDIKIGNGLLFSNDTLKVADNIINSGDTATLLRKDFLGINTNVLVWTEGNKKLLPYFTQVYRNGQLLKSDSQYIISSDSIVTLEEGSYRLGDNITIIAIDNIVALAGSGGIITLQGDVTGSGTNSITTNIGVSKITNTMLAGSISDTKLNTITTAGKISNSATTATNSNTGNTIVSRDASGNFSAGTITASLNGNAATVTSVLPSNFASQTANTVLAAPNGSSGTPTFRSLVSSDIPSLNYLPLSGGVLSGGLTGTTGTFTGLNINNTTTEGIFTLQGYDNNTATRIQFKTGNIVRQEIIKPTSASNLQFRSYPTGTASGGYEFYVSNGSTESLAATIGIDKSLSLTGALGVTSNITANSFIKSGGLSTQFLKADGSVDANTYLTQSNAASTYLPLTGGTLTGGLTVATAGVPFTVNSTNSNTNKIAISDNGTIRSYLGANNTKLFTVANPSTTELMFIDNNGVNRINASGVPMQINSTNSNTNKIAFYDAGANTGYIASSLMKPFIVNNSLTTEVASISDAGNASFAGNITEAGNNVLTNLDTASLSSRIDSKFNSSGGTISGAVTLSTTTATPTSLLGKDGSNVVGTVTTVAQTGLMTRGETTATTGSPSATFTVTHGLGFNPTAVLVTSAGIGGGDKIIFEVYTKNDTTFAVQAWNYDGTEASGKTVKIYWLALK